MMNQNLCPLLFLLTIDFIFLKLSLDLIWSFCHNRIRRAGRAKIKERSRCSQCSQYIHFSFKHIPVSHASILWRSGRNRDRASKRNGIFFSWKRSNQEILCFRKGFSGTCALVLSRGYYYVDFRKYGYLVMPSFFWLGR